MQIQTKYLISQSLSLPTQANTPKNEQEQIFDLPSHNIAINQHVYKDSSPIIIHTVTLHTTSYLK